MHLSITNRNLIISLFLKNYPIHVIKKTLKTKYETEVSRISIYKLIKKHHKKTMQKHQHDAKAS